MFKGLKARLNDTIGTNDASFMSAYSSTPNTSMTSLNNEQPGPGPGLFGKFKQRLSEAVANSSFSSVNENETFESVAELTEEEYMEIDKIVIVTPPAQLPDLLRKQAVSRLKLRKKLKYVIGQYNDVVHEHNLLQDQDRVMKEELTKARTCEALATEYKQQLSERSELIYQLQSQVEILKETALVPEPANFNNTSGAALIDISECSESIMSDTSETVHNMTYEQLYDRYQRYRLRYNKNKERLDKLSGTCQRLQKQNEKLQNCLTLSQDRAIKRINQLKDTTSTVVDEHREMKYTLDERDERINTLKEQLLNISNMGPGFSDTESIMSEASEYSDQIADALRRKNTKLKDKNKRLEEILGKCKDTIKSGIDTSANLSTEKELLQSRIDRLQFEVDEMKTVSSVANCGEGRDTVSEQVGVLIDVSEPRTPTNTVVEDAARKIADLEALVSEYKHEEETRASEICVLVSDIEHFKQDNMRLTEALATKTSAVCSADDKMSQLTQHSTSLQQQLATLTQDLQIKENGFHSSEEEYKKDIARLEETIGGLQREKEELEQSLHDFDVAKVMELQDLRQDHTGQITILNNKIDALKHSLNNANSSIALLKDTDTSLQDVMEEMGGLRMEMERLATENTHLAQQIHTHKQETQHLRSEHSHALQNLHSEHRQTLETVHVQREEERKEWNVRETESKCELAGLVTERTNLAEDCTRLAAELNLLSEDLEVKKGRWQQELQELEVAKISEREQVEELHRSQLTAFKAKIKEMQTQISKLTEEKEEQEQEISDLTRHVFESNSDCAQLNNDLTELQCKAESTDKALSVNQDELSAKSAEIAGLTDTVNSLNSKLTVVQLTLTELHKQIDSVTQEKRELAALSEERERKCVTLQHHNKDLDMLVGDLRRKMSNSDEEFRLKSEQLQETISNIIQDKDTLQEQLAQLREQNTALSSSLSSNSSGTETLTLEKQQLQQEHVELQDRWRETQNTLQERAELVTMLTEEKEKLQESLTELTKSRDLLQVSSETLLSETKHKLEELENEKREGGENVRELKEQYTSLKSDFQSIGLEYNDKLETLHQLTRELEDSKEQSETYSAQIQDLGQQVEAVKNANKQLLNERETLQNERETLQNERETLRKDKAALDVELSDLQSQYDTLNTTIQGYVLQETKKQEELSAVKEELEKTRGELEKTRADHQLTGEELSKKTTCEGTLSEENEALHHRLKELETDLDIKTKHLTKQNTEHLKQLSDLESQMLSYKTDLDSSRTTTELLQKQCDKLEILCRQGEDTIAQTERELSGKIEGVQEEKDRLETRLQEEKERGQELLQQQDLAKSGMAKAKEVIGQLKRRVKDQENKIGNLEKVRDELDNQLAVAATRHTEDLAEVQESLMGKLEASAEAENSLKVGNKKLQQEVSSLLSEQTELQNIAEKHCQEKKQLSEIMKLKIAENTGLHTENTGLHTENEKLCGEIGVLKGKMVKDTELHTTLQECNVTLQDKDKRLSQLTSEIKQLENATQTYMNTISQIEGLIQEYKSDKDREPDNDNKQVKSTNISSQIKELLHARQEQTQQLHCELKTGAEQRNQLQVKLVELKKKADSRISELNEQRKHADKDVEDLKSKQIAHRDELEATKLLISDLQNEDRNSKEIISTLTTQIAEIRGSTSSSVQELQASYEGVISDLKEKNEELVSGSSETRDKIRLLEAAHQERMSLKDQTITLLESRSAELETQVNNTMSELESYKTSLAQELESHKTSLAQELESHKTSLAQATGEVATLREADQHHQLHTQTLTAQLAALREELGSSQSCLEKQDQVQEASLQSEERLRAELDKQTADNAARSNTILELEEEISSLKHEITSRGEETAALSALCAEFKSKIKENGDKLEGREEAVRKLQEHNAKLSAHSNNLEVCFASLKEEKNKIVDMLSNMDKDIVQREEQHKALLSDTVAQLNQEHAQTLNRLKEEKDKIVDMLSNMDKDIVQREEQHKALLSDTVAQLNQEHAQTLKRLNQEHALTLEQLNRSMKEKVQSASQSGAQDAQNALQSHIKKLEGTLLSSQREREERQAAHTVSISQYSQKLLNSEKKIAALQSVLTNKSNELSDCKLHSIPRTEHEEIVFSLEMAYNMNNQELKDTFESKLKALEKGVESNVAGSGSATTGANAGSSTAGLAEDGEVAKLKYQLVSLAKHHHTALETVKNEALFEARQDCDRQLSGWKENIEQKHFEDMNRILEDNARERQRLLREVEILQHRAAGAGSGTATTGPLDTLNTSAGRISVSSEAGSELYLLDTEFEYLKQVLYKYLRGEHTQHLLKVIIAICRYTESEKLELLKKV